MPRVFPANLVMRSYDTTASLCVGVLMVMTLPKGMRSMVACEFTNGRQRASPLTACQVTMFSVGTVPVSLGGDAMRPMSLYMPCELAHPEGLTSGGRP